MFKTVFGSLLQYIDSTHKKKYHGTLPMYHGTLAMYHGTLLMYHGTFSYGYDHQIKYMFYIKYTYVTFSALDIIYKGISILMCG